MFQLLSGEGSPVICSETVPVAAWLLPLVPHVNMSSCCHPSAAQPAQVAGPWSDSGGLPDRTVSQPGRLIMEQHKGVRVVGRFMALLMSLNVVEHNVCYK